MKRFLIGSVVAVLCMGAPAVHADDTHQHEHGGAPESKSSNSAGDSSVADAQMGKAQERMKQAQALMGKLRETKDPAERKKLMQQHTQAMRDTMDIMRGMKMGMMGCGQGKGMKGGGDHKMGSMGGDQDMGMMGCGQGKGMKGGDDHKMGSMGGDQDMGMMGMMGMHRMMQERMGMIQMMLEQLFERQEILMQDEK